MKIDHMIFNSKKWYEGQMQNYIGKKIKLPLKPIPFYGDPNPYNGTGDVKNTILSITENGGRYSLNPHLAWLAVTS